jgi:hypothetical protein
MWSKLWWNINKKENRCKLSDQCSLINVFQIWFNVYLLMSYMTRFGLWIFMSKGTHDFWLCFNLNIENCLKYNFIKLSCNWHVKSSAIYTPNAYEVICRVAIMAELLRLIQSSCRSFIGVIVPYEISKVNFRVETKILVSM